MSDLISNEVLYQGAGESILHAVDLTGYLRKPLGWQPGEATTATISTLTSITDIDNVLTLANKAIISSNVVPRHMPDTEILANQGVQFRASGGVAGTRYCIKVIVVDSDSNTFEHYVYLQIQPAVTA